MSYKSQKRKLFVRICIEIKSDLTLYSALPRLCTCTCFCLQKKIEIEMNIYFDFNSQQEVYTAILRSTFYISNKFLHLHKI